MSLNDRRLQNGLRQANSWQDVCVAILASIELPAPSPLEYCPQCGTVLVSSIGGSHHIGGVMCRANQDARAQLQSAARVSIPVALRDAYERLVDACARMGEPSDLLRAIAAARKDGAK